MLGIEWCFTQDTLLFDIRHIADIGSVEGPTKRSVVSVSARFYDPLGILSPCIVMFKIFLQRLWEAGLNWDDPLTGDFLTTWNKLIAEVARAPIFSFPRCYFENVADISFTICGFCDASCKAYAAVVYLRITCYMDSQVSLYWITSRKEWKQFVQNLVNEIQSLVPIESWRHCSGDSNPADLPSRGVTPTELYHSKLWLEGPDWLKTTSDNPA